MPGGFPLPWRLALDVTTPTVTLLLAWMSIQSNSRCLFLLALLVALVGTLIQVVDRWVATAEERTNHEQTSRLIEYLAGEIDWASGMEQRIRGNMDNAGRFEHYRDEIEGWRTRTGDELERLLRRTGASQIFLAALGQTGGGGLVWEYTQLRGWQEAIVSILGSADSFVRRSRTIRR